MSFESAGYQLLPVLPELVLAVGAMVLLMIGAYRGPQTTGLVTGLAVCLLVLCRRAGAVRCRPESSRPSAAASSSTTSPGS